MEIRNETILEPTLKPSKLVNNTILIENEIEQQVDPLLREVEKDTQRSPSNAVKVEPLDEVRVENHESGQMNPAETMQIQEVSVKLEPVLNINEGRNQMDGDSPNKCLESGIPTLLLNSTDVTEANYLQAIKQEVLDDCEQAACESIMKTIEQNFDEIDEIICGNLDGRSRFNKLNKETDRKRIEMVELEQFTKETADDHQKLNLTDVLDTVDRYESSHIGDKTENVNMDKNAVIEDYTSGSDTDPYCCDSDNKPDKGGGYTSGSETDPYCCATDSEWEKSNDDIETSINNHGDTVDGSNTKVNEKALLRKYDISECCVHLKDIDGTYNETKSLLLVRTANQDTANTEFKCSEIGNGKPAVCQKPKSVQCKVCLMNMKNLKSLLIHGRIHMKFVLMCCFCGPLYRYNTEAAFEKHMAKHGNSVLECTICGRICPNERKLKYHGIRHGIKPFPCILCPKSYFSTGDLADHMRTHIDARPFKCSSCSLTFTSSRRLGQHVKNCHEDQERRYQCKICDKKFKRKEHLKSHETHAHSDARPYVCQVCGKSYKGRGSLSLHQRSHTGERVTCEVCGRIFRDPGDLKKHKKVVHDNIKSFKCDTCGHSFANQSNLNVHIQHRHSDPSTIVKKFKCDKCEGRFVDHSSLRTHMKVHIETADYKCPHCEKRFKCKDYLEKHVRTIHDRTNGKIQCSECPKTFTAKEGLRKHMKFHKFGPRYRCKTCGATFMHTNHLKRHVQHSHLGVKLPHHKCKLCGKKVVNLRVHIASHSTAKPYHCKECGRQFRNEKMLGLHSRIHWDTKPFNCKFCKTAFTRKGNYQQHMRKVHKM